jgi:hypothetical protein
MVFPFTQYPIGAVGAPVEGAREIAVPAAE